MDLQQETLLIDCPTITSQSSQDVESLCLPQDVIQSLIAQSELVHQNPVLSDNNKDLNNHNQQAIIVIEGPDEISGNIVSNESSESDKGIIFLDENVEENFQNQQQYVYVSQESDGVETFSELNLPTLLQPNPDTLGVTNLLDTSTNTVLCVTTDSVQSNIVQKEINTIIDQQNREEETIILGDPKIALISQSVPEFEVCLETEDRNLPQANVSESELVEASPHGISAKEATISHTNEINLKPHLGEVIRCKICSRHFQAGAYQKHFDEVHRAVSSQHNSNKECSVCHKLLSKKDFLTHFKEAHSDVRLGCPKCPKNYHSPELLNVHYKHFHLKNQCKKDSSDHADIMEIDDANPPLIKQGYFDYCQECKIKVPNLEEHYKTTHQISLQNENNLSKTKKSLIPQYKLYCTICEKSFFTQREFANHRRRKNFCRPPRPPIEDEVPKRRIGIIRRKV